MRHRLAPVFNLWPEWIYHPDKGDLLHSIGIFPDGTTDLLVDLGLILLGGQLNEKVTGIHLKQGRE